MKKILFLLLAMVALSSNARIFNYKMVYDRFDDVIEQKSIKTIIEQTDSTFVIEEKGGRPVKYYIMNILEENCSGDENNIVNLVSNVYGYQTCWSVVMEKDLENYRNGIMAAILETDENARKKIIEKTIDDYCYYITRRVVTTQYTHSYISEYVWIQKGDNNGRTIYTNKD